MGATGRHPGKRCLGYHNPNTSPTRLFGYHDTCKLQFLLSMRSDELGIEYQSCIGIHVACPHIMLRCQQLAAASNTRVECNSLLPATLASSATRCCQQHLRRVQLTSASNTRVEYNSLLPATLASSTTHCCMEQEVIGE